MARRYKPREFAIDALVMVFLSILIALAAPL